MYLLSAGTGYTRHILLSKIILAPGLAAVLTPIVLNQGSKLFVGAVLAMRAILILTAVDLNALVSFSCKSFLNGIIYLKSFDFSLIF